MSRQITAKLERIGACACACACVRDFEKLQSSSRDRDTRIIALSGIVSSTGLTFDGIPEYEIPMS